MCIDLCIRLETNSVFLFITQAFDEIKIQCIFGERERKNNMLASSCMYIKRKTNNYLNAIQQQMQNKKKTRKQKETN